MDPNEYDVEVVYRQRVIYRVKGDNREEAEREALKSWQRGEPSSVAGYDWSELETVHAVESTGAQREAEDAEMVVRFLSERERLIQRLGAGSYGSLSQDAISAAQVASDLGWARRSTTGISEPDVVRAAQALERLCAEKRVVCFERPRVRTGERGEIRLYCTPEYLERLTSEIVSLERQVG